MSKYLIALTLSLSSCFQPSFAHDMKEQAGCPMEEAMTIEALIFQTVLRKHEIEDVMETPGISPERLTELLNELQGLMLNLEGLTAWGYDCLDRYENELSKVE